MFGSEKVCRGIMGCFGAWGFWGYRGVLGYNGCLGCKWGERGLNGGLFRDVKGVLGA